MADNGAVQRAQSAWEDKVRKLQTVRSGTNDKAAIAAAQAEHDAALTQLGAAKAAAGKTSEPGNYLKKLFGR